MKDILFHVFLSTMVAISRAEINEKTIKDLQRFGELLNKAGPFSSTKIRQNRGIRCTWEFLEFENRQDLSCEEIQDHLETDDRLKNLKKLFREICPVGDLDMCLKEKDSSGVIVRSCFCSRTALKVRDELNKCYKNGGDGSRSCFCNDKNYCNRGDNFDHYDSSASEDGSGRDHKDGTDGRSRGYSGRGSGGELPSALAATTLVILGLFAPWLF